MTDKKNTDFDLSPDGSSMNPASAIEEGDTMPNISGDVQDQPQDQGDKETGTRSGSAETSTPGQGEKTADKKQSAKDSGSSKK